MIKRSLSIRGHRTSISLEEPFWEELQNIAWREGISVSALVTRIDENRTLPSSGKPHDGHTMHGLSSTIRVYVLNDALKRKTG